jgi:hypothetical protein
MDSVESSRDYMEQLDSEYYPGRRTAEFLLYLRGDNGFGRYSNLTLSCNSRVDAG